MLVTTENLSIGYRNYVVQSNLNLVVDKGNLICMLGTNGCGKSTLLRTLAGLQPSLGGKVFLQGQSLADLSAQQKAKLFALVLTDPVETKNMTVYDVIALGRYPYSSWLGNLSEEDKHFILRALLQVKLQHKTFSRISELSDGERQRVMIARALAQDTPLILLDEPTAHLDLPNRVDTMLLLRRLAHETGKAVVLSSHELDLALQTADRLWLMSPQKGMYCGLPEDLVSWIWHCRPQIGYGLCLRKKVCIVVCRKTWCFQGLSRRFLLRNPFSLTRLMEISLLATILISRYMYMVIR